MITFALDAGSLNTMLTMVNTVRGALGRPPLSISPELNESAQKYSQVQANLHEMGHSDDGTQFTDRIKAAQYNGFPTAENVAEGLNSVQAVVQEWIASPGHYANIISADSNQVGLGVATASDGTMYWTQDFGNGGQSGNQSPGPSAPTPVSKSANYTPSPAPQVHVAPIHKYTSPVAPSPKPSPEPSPKPSPKPSPEPSAVPEPKKKCKSKVQSQDIPVSMPTEAADFQSFESLPAIATESQSFESLPTVAAKSLSSPTQAPSSYNNTYSSSSSSTVSACTLVLLGLLTSI